MKIAIVEDEQKLASLLQDYLHKDGYETTHYADGTTALQELQQDPPDLILLDLMLPGTDGMTICRELRATSSVPIIMMTARVEEIDRLLGLEVGADDYICKPYSPRELVARVKAVLRRTQTSQNPPDTGFQLSENEAMVRLNGNSCELTQVELSLLKTMAAHPGRIYNRQQLIQRIYSDNRVVSDRTIDSHIKKLRQKLKQLDNDVEYIHSVCLSVVPFYYRKQVCR